jgi:putative transcriptional regulator
MPIMRKSMAALLGETKDFVMPPRPSEDEVRRQAAADPDAPPTTDEELGRAEVVPALLQPEAVRAIRTRLGLTQTAFAQRFGFSVEAIRNYEQGLRQPPAPIRAYLRVIAAETEAVDWALAS